jgi:multiple sugar transport system substrate-binding protein
MIFSQTDFDSVGVAAPNSDTTWDEWAELCAAVHKANSQLYGSAEASSENNLYGGWMRQLGKSVFTPDGKLGIDGTDVAQWLGFWQKMRDLNACVPADLAAQDKGNAETNGLTTGYAAISFSNAQQLLTYQSMNKDQLKLTTYPKHVKGGETGHTIYTPMLWSISAKSPNIDQSVDLINFLINEPEVAKLFGVDRGVPINKNMHQYAIPEGDESTRMVVDLVGQIVDSGAPPNLPEPPASGEILTLLRRYSEEVGFGTLTAEEAGKRYIADAQEALDRAMQ